MQEASESLTRARRWKRENKEHVAASAAVYHEAHKVEINARRKKWNIANPVRRAAQAAKVNARRRGAAVPSDFRVEDTMPFYAKAKQLSIETGVPHEVDHILPICQGGQHTASNLQVLTKQENRSKHAGRRTASN